MEITLANLQKKIRLNPAQVQRITKSVLRKLGVKSANISLVFVTSQKIKALNKKYLGRNYVTDVLAFDLIDLSRGGSRPAPTGKAINGEIIICTDTAKKNAKKFDTTIKHELALYVIHGILHLLGYDDHTKKDTERMRRKEASLMKFLGNKIKTITR